MAASITDVLYDWMHRRRILRLVADEMGVKESTLYAELGRGNANAKLGADALVPMFQAIRRVGWGDELEGILHNYIEQLKGTDYDAVSDEDLIPHVLTLGQSLGILSECAARIQQISDESELVKLIIMLRTEVLPVVMKMEATLETRLKTVRKKKDRSILLLVPKLKPASNAS
jgi:hypothetical protein